MTTQSIKVHPFYTENDLRLHICPGDVHHPVEKGYPLSDYHSVDVQKWLDDGKSQPLLLDT